MATERIIDCYENRGKLEAADVNKVSDSVTYIRFSSKSHGKEPIHKMTTSGGLTSIRWAFGEWVNYAVHEYTMDKNTNLVIHNPDMLLYLPLSEASAESGTNQKITTTSGVTYKTEKNIPCACFSASYNEQITVSTESADICTGIEANQAFTISLWVLGGRSKDSTCGIVYIGDSTNAVGIAQCGWDGSNTVHGFIRINGEWANPEQPPIYWGRVRIPGGNYGVDYWHNIIVTYKNRTLTCYLDGCRQGSSSSTSDTMESKGDITFGDTKDVYIAKQIPWSIYATESKYTGNVASVRVYDHAISEDEIKALAAEFTPTNS